MDISKITNKKIEVGGYDEYLGKLGTIFLIGSIITCHLSKMFWIMNKSHDFFQKLRVKIVSVCTFIILCTLFFPNITYNISCNHANQKFLHSFWYIASMAYFSKILIQSLNFKISTLVILIYAFVYSRITLQKFRN